jgi:hypothetical protein
LTFALPQASCYKHLVWNILIRNDKDQSASFF